MVLDEAKREVIAGKKKSEEEKEEEVEEEEEEGKEGKEEVEGEREGEGRGTGRVLVVVNDERTCYQLKQVCCVCGKSGLVGGCGLI